MHGRRSLYDIQQESERFWRAWDGLPPAAPYPSGLHARRMELEGVAIEQAARIRELEQDTFKLAVGLKEERLWRGDVGRIVQERFEHAETYRADRPTDPRML